MGRVSLLTGIGLLSLSACGQPVETSDTTLAARAAPQVARPVVTPESAALRAHFSSVQQSLLTRDLLRTDGGGIDTPYTAEMLTRNFANVALREEYANLSSGLVARSSESTLHRWETPVRITAEFGGAIPSEQIAVDRQSIRRFAERLGRVTRHPVSFVNANANFHVFVVDEAARRNLGPRLREIVPELSANVVSAVVNMPRSHYCLVFAWDPNSNGIYRKAVAVVRAEHPDLLRLSCFHEEIAQGMGLANDSPTARPSIFNDDEEFALLTQHDEELLRILYDPRLSPGMDASEAVPIVRKIAQSRLSGAS